MTTYSIQRIMVYTVNIPDNTRQEDIEQACIAALEAGEGSLKNVEYDYIEGE